MLVAVIMGRGRSGPGDLPSRWLIRRRRSWQSRLLRAARFFRKVALTRKPPCLGIVRMCFHLHYSENTGGFRAFSQKNGDLIKNDACFGTRMPRARVN